MKQSFSATQFRHILTPKALIISSFIAFFYLCVLIFAPNYRLVSALFYNDYSISAKLTIIKGLFISGFVTQSPLGLFLLLLTATLIGLNVALLTRNYQTVRKNGNAHFVSGGSMVLGFVSTSCAMMCGFSLLPLIGTSIGASFSVLDGVPFRLMTVFLLTLSLFYTMHSSLDKRLWLTMKST